MHKAILWIIPLKNCEGKVVVPHTGREHHLCSICGTTALCSQCSQHTHLMRCDEDRSGHLCRVLWVYIAPLPRILPGVVQQLSLKLTVSVLSTSRRGMKVQSQISETQCNQDEEKAYLCKNKTNSVDFNVEKYRKASENTHIIISVYDRKLLDSILGSHVKKDTILKWVNCIQ